VVSGFQRGAELLYISFSLDLDSKKPALSDDPDVAELQQRADVPRPMAEQAVKERRRRAVAEMPPSTDKVQ
jgi:hypothetical protein